VTTGIGRTGTWFGYQQYGVEPDIMTLAKALGGGIAIGGLVAKPEVAKSLVPGTHASTFGGNPLAAAAAVATFEAIEKENLLENTVRMGEFAMGRLSAMKEKFGFIRDVRGKGLMLGMELDRPGAPVVQRCLERRLLINCTHDSVVRMLPAMNVGRDVMDEGLTLLEEVLATVA